MVDTPTSEVLYRAADLIEERGWGRGSESMRALPDTPLCLEGAIAAATGSDTHMGGGGRVPAGTPLYSYRSVQGCEAAQAVRDYLNLPGRRLWQWNDNVALSAQRVVEVLRAAAVVEAAKENAEVRESVTSDA